MRVVTAIDSFKGSMSSIEAGEAVAKGIHRVDKNIEVDVRPLADGGEGTVETLTAGMDGTFDHVWVTGPLGDPVECTYGILPDKTTAVIEMSGAAGITLISRDKLSPLKATTYGVGEVIRHAIVKGCRRFLIGIGGSATNDGGIGMLQALGFGFYDEYGKEVSRGAKGLQELAYISDENAMEELKECTFLVACDVTNPLCGPEGASAVYGPQKGADEKLVRDMDNWMKHYAELVNKRYPDKHADIPGTGAAGGMGFAFLSFLHAQLRSGIDLVLEETGLEDYIRQADIVITGEGRIDGQTAMGKAPVGVAGLAKKYKKPVIAFAGAVTRDAVKCHEKGIDAIFPILRGITTLEEAMEIGNAKQNMADTAEQVFRLWRL